MKGQFLLALRLIIFISLSILIASCAMRPTPDQFAAADYGPYPSNYENMIKEYYSKQLIDPYSAVFTFGRPQKAWNGLGGGLFGWVVCGTMNAKNRFGGYVGAKHYYVLFVNNTIERDYTETIAEGFCQNFK